MSGRTCPRRSPLTSDPTRSPRFGRELAAAIPDARLEVRPGGHGYFWEAPEAFDAACHAFLADVDRA